MYFSVSDERIAEDNQRRLAALEADYAHLGRQLARRGIDIEALTDLAMEFRVALPSWALAAGGTRFGRFPAPASHRRSSRRWRTAPRSMRWSASRRRSPFTFPGTGPSVRQSSRRSRRPAACASIPRTRTRSRIIPDSAHSYRFGSLTHTDPAVRARRSSTTSSASPSAPSSARRRIPSGSATAPTSPGRCIPAARSIGIWTA